MPKEAPQPSGLHKPPTYSQVVKAGNTVYVAGQTASPGVDQRAVATWERWARLSQSP